jgi:hypothetical protein
LLLTELALQADLLPALNTVTTLSVLQPADTASGMACTFSVNVVGSVTSVSFYVIYGSYSTLVGTATVATVPDGSGGGVFSTTVDTLRFSSADGYTFSAVASIGGTTVSTSKVVKIDNSGPQVVLTISPSLVAPFLFDNVNAFTATATYAAGPDISRVSFFMDLSGGTSTLLGTATSAPFSMAFSATTLPLYTLVTIRAVPRSSDGRETVATLSGIVAQPNLAPTDIVLTAAAPLSGGAPSIPEDSVGGKIVGSLSAVDPNPGDVSTYTVTSGSKFTVLGSSLVVAAGATFDFFAASSFSITLLATDSGGLTTSKSFTVFINRVNKPPTAIALSRTSLPENSAVNSLVGTFSVTARDSSTFSMLLVNTGSGSFYVSGMSLYVAKSLSYNSAPTVTIGVQATDSNGLSLIVNIPITVTWVNKAPTSIVLSNARVLVCICCCCFLLSRAFCSLVGLVWFCRNAKCLAPLLALSVQLIRTLARPSRTRSSPMAWASLLFLAALW